nr:hypothetical protein [Tanacetum cinerariifolium]
MYRCDKWYWSYDASGCFKGNVLSKVLENFLLGGHSLGLHHRWNSWIPKKINVTVWKACLNRLATRPNPIARGVTLPSFNFPLCDSKVEDIENILVKCPNVRNLNIQGCLKIVKAINGVFQITLWAVWSWRNRLTHAIGYGIIKIKNEDIFLGIQSISKIWMSARIRSNVKTKWKCWVAKPFDLFS